MNKEKTMELTIRQIKEFIKWCKKQGMTKITIGDITVECPENYQTAPELTNTNDTSMTDEEPTAEDALFWSS